MSVAETNFDRIARRRVDKFAERRDQLAEAALHTLSELGYARTSLREIAQNSEFSHGVLHYYFRDKVDLITHCVRFYKARCVTRYDDVVATAQTPSDLEDGFGAAMSATLREEATMHRLWYDLRAQSMFEESFRDDVADINASLENMIWRIVTRYAEILEVQPVLSSRVTYAMFDGVFQHSLLEFLSGRTEAADDLVEDVKDVLRAALPGAATT
ncbi:TetR/AcrR family transcriptional regulator [Antrihabitans cavernicola]|uniref:TetR family transcriptional regulator n=1 Tax=Antrihabitans cavernicola TaxID=2495913 RepID=A0A5A7SIR2_9NOCA|nr:TetR/AcrR family transcriptional regulator [Spelaeibacter cavernicola]KAA0024483.1 TetR family transcriptional regulator [Spelaeibacter cavernicola]